MLKKTALLSALCLSLVQAVPTLADPLGVAGAPTSSTLAPADRYFGSLQMSILGMRNAIKDVSAYTEATGADVSNLLHKLTLVEESVSDLRTKFPKDTWVPQLGLSLAQAFAKIHIGDASVRSNDAIDWIIADYPLSDQAFEAKGMRAASFAVATSVIVPIEASAIAP